MTFGLWLKLVRLLHQLKAVQIFYDAFRRMGGGWRRKQNRHIGVQWEEPDISFYDKHAITKVTKQRLASRMVLFGSFNVALMTGVVFECSGVV